MGFRNLLNKETRSFYPLFSVYTVLVMLLHLIIWYKSSVLDDGMMFALSVVFPLQLAAVIAIGVSYYQLHVEWKTNSIYLLLSLPIRGWKVLTAKLIAVLILLIVTIILIGASYSLILMRISWEEWVESEGLSTIVPMVLNMIFHLFWMYLLTVIFIYVLTQFAFLSGQLVTRFKSVVMLSSFIGMLWLVIWISPPVSNLLLWTPGILLGDKDTDFVYLYSGPFIVLLLLSIGLMALNGWIFEKEVEV